MIIAFMGGGGTSALIIGLGIIGLAIYLIYDSKKTEKRNEKEELEEENRFWVAKRSATKVIEDLIIDESKKQFSFRKLLPQHFSFSSLDSVKLYTGSKQEATFERRNSNSILLSDQLIDKAIDPKWNQIEGQTSVEIAESVIVSFTILENSNFKRYEVTCGKGYYGKPVNSQEYRAALETGERYVRELTNIIKDYR
ncbi:hypothetical protein [Facklamia miroungae]|nr:hypothetical protein [Facklamia miroungae]